MYDPSKIEQLRELMNDDQAEMLSLVEEYEGNSTSLIQQMLDATARRSALELTRAAHTLKSSSALMGASGLARLCEELETLSHQGKIPPDVEERIRQITTEFAEASRWLRAQICG
ncbi:MAG: Hpt domain-containing protein [Myxococcales bacterium]|nr:Hpt domain-containing protein [Myxococcales bacterium]